MDLITLALAKKYTDKSISEIDVTTKGVLTILKTYSSIEAMNSGFATDGVPEGGLVLINTGNVDDADNAKLYVKGETVYEYLTDLSGSPGIQGPQGDKPVKGTDYFTDADKEELVADVLSALPTWTGGSY